MSTAAANRLEFEVAPRGPEPVLGWAVRALVATVWISAGLFALYILGGYVGLALSGNAEGWNDLFPQLYAHRSLAANLGIGSHFALGAVLLLLGPIQLIERVRARAPRLHRWTGWVYASAALFTGIGGTVYIVGKGTIGGAAMDIAFAIYGALMAVSAVQTVRFAVARRLDTHRAWAIRLFALAIGSWLYRMDYGFWFMVAGNAGHTRQFDGAFDLVMLYWFYVPNLVVAELFVRGRRPAASPAMRVAASGSLWLASGFIALGTFFFTWKAWGPVILNTIGLG